MKVQFNVQMTRQYLFDFFLQHTYRTLRGKLSLLAGLAMIPLCVLTWNRVGRMFSVCYIFFAVFFLLLIDRKSTRLNSCHITPSRMPSSA